MTVYEGCSSNA